MRILYTLLLLITICSSCYKLDNGVRNDYPISDNYYPNEKTADKNYPYFDRYVERSYPTYVVDAEGYAQAKERVYAELSNHQKSIGFDEEWDVEGPYNLGGRVSAIAVHPTDENVIFLGFTTGGIYKTTDGGRNWTAVFDDKPFLSIGAITIDPINPEIVYAGTGDPIIGGVPHIGDGLYKSVDSGDTWVKMGLVDQRIISSIAVDKQNPEKLFVSSLGMPFFKGADTRGIFSSEDGGTSWEQVYSYSDSTGFTDVVINPEQQNYIYGTGWDRVRRRYFSILRGEGSNFHMSRDGGVTWEKDLPGLPGGVHCKTGMAVCEEQPNNVFVLYVGSDLTFEGIYRSEDYGETFTEVPTQSLPGDDLMSEFGWFFGSMAVNPKDPDHIVVCGIELWETRNGGQNWSRATPPWFFYEVHADCHEVVFSGDDLYLGTDGGAYRRDANGGEFDWEDIEDIPSNLFYRVAYNPHQPEDVFGGMQDNGTSGGNKDLQEWPRLWGGDGFQPVFNPLDPNHYFFEVQRGAIYYTVDGIFLDLADDGLGESRPWDTPYLMSQHNTDVMYAATDQVFICRDSKFPFWEPFSEQIYFNATGLSESPVRPGIVYASFSDGSILMTESAGANWDVVNSGLPNKYPSSIKASPSHEASAYVTYSGYTEFDNQAYIFKTDNFGSNWTDITGNLPDIPVNDIFIIPDNEDQFLFIASDVGVYGSRDGGITWERVGANMPIVIVNDLDYNPQTNTLLAGTFGKSIMSYSLEGIVPPTNVIEVAELLFEVTPTVTREKIFINLDGNALSQARFTLYNSAGQLIDQPRLGADASYDVAHLQSGIYFLHIESAEGRGVSKFVKM